MIKQFTHEYKHYISFKDQIGLENTLKSITKYDSYSDMSGKYTMRTLLFDYKDKRKKERFSIRYYNGNTNWIRLEKKIQEGKRIFRHTTHLSKLQCMDLLYGSYDWMKESEDILIQELYFLLSTSKIEPVEIIECERDAYLFITQHVRFTVDHDIRSTQRGFTLFLDDSLPTFSCGDRRIFKIKYDGKLPTVLCDLLKLQNEQLQVSALLV